MSLASRIRRARTLRAMSQSELARKLKVHRSCVGHWEGVHNSSPGHARLVGVAKVLGVSFEWLATGRGALKLGHDPADDIPAAFGKLVDDPDTLRMLRAWELIPSRSRGALLEIAEQLAKARKRKLVVATDTVSLESGVFDSASGDRLP
jgi:transcriptional regulator with XRE-family HTH domain